MTSRGPRIGDTFEVATRAGLAYLQLTHDHQEFGTLVRALPGLYSKPPDDLGSLIAGPTRFVAFYPTGIGVRRSWVKPVGSFPIPADCRDFPVMKWPMAKMDDTLVWVLWDGQREGEPLGTLSDSEMDSPSVQIVDHDTLLDRLSTSWTWRSETEFELAEAAAVAEEKRGE